MSFQILDIGLISVVVVELTDGISLVLPTISRNEEQGLISQRNKSRTGG